MSRILQGLAHVRIFSLAEDWADCAVFYRDTLGLDEIYIDPDHGVAVYEIGPDVTLGLERVPEDEPDEWEMAGRFSGISFRVGDMERAHELYAARGVEFDSPPEKMEWGGILAHFRDPAGNVLTLVQEPTDEDLLGAG